MRKTFCTALLLLASFSAFAQDVVTTDANTQNGLIAVAILIIVVAIMAHMIYENFFRKDLNTDYTAAAFRDARKAQNQGDMSAQEAMALDSELDKMVDMWGELANEDGDMVPYPLKRSVVKKSLATLEAAVAAMPTNSRIVERINDANEILNHALKRQFNGSKAMVITAVIVGIVFTAISGTVEAAISVGVGIILYLLASRSATFLIAAKQVKGSGSNSFLTMLIGSLFMGVATAKTYKTVTTYSDGSTKTETDNSQTWFSLIFGLIVMILLSFLLAIIAVINYLRNYILYI